MKTILITKLLAGAFITVSSLTAFTTNANDAIKNNIQTVTKTASSIASHAAVSIYSAVLNQNLRVIYAVDNGVDITNDMDEWTFRFVGNTPGGEAQGWNDILASSGTWSMAKEGSHISIAFPPTVSQLIFMSKDWTIGGGMGRGPAIVFTSADGDEVHFISDIQ